MPVALERPSRKSTTDLDECDEPLPIGKSEEAEEKRGKEEREKRESKKKKKQEEKQKEIREKGK